MLGVKKTSNSWKSIREKGRGLVMLQGRRQQTVRLTVAQALVKYLQCSSVCGMAVSPLNPGHLRHLRSRERGRSGTSALRIWCGLPLLSALQRTIHGPHRCRIRQGELPAGDHGLHFLDWTGSHQYVDRGATATINRLPVLLLPSDYYVTRHQGPVLQQLEHPISPMSA